MYTTEPATARARLCARRPGQLQRPDPPRLSVMSAERPEADETSKSRHLSTLTTS